jgi:hypothetical protein
VSDVSSSGASLARDFAENVGAQFWQSCVARTLLIREHELPVGLRGLTAKMPLDRTHGDMDNTKVRID